MVREEFVLKIRALHQRGASKNNIARSLGLNWRTVARYIAEPAPQGPSVGRPRLSGLDAFEAKIKSYAEESYTYKRIHELIAAEGCKVGYDQLRRLARGYRKERSLIAYERFETEPGRQGQVDFSDWWVDNPDGSRVKIYNFGFILGYSRADFFRLVARPDLETFLDCHVAAFEALGGVPREIVYDNMKNVVSRRAGGAVLWNKSFLDFANYYGFEPIAAPPYAPAYKGKIERPFRDAREGFWRGYPFANLERANVDLEAWTAGRYAREHGTVRERVDVRHERERPFLGALPPAHFDTSPRIYRTVAKDCTVRFANNAYVLPHKLVGQAVVLRPKNGHIRVFHGADLIVDYAMPAGRGQLVQDVRYYAALRSDEEQRRRKYSASTNRPGRKASAKKTTGIVGACREYAPVEPRSIEDYERHVSALG
jgi:transposase